MGKPWAIYRHGVDRRVTTPLEPRQSKSVVQHFTDSAIRTH